MWENFAEVSKNLASYGYGNDFVGSGNNYIEISSMSNTTKSSSNKFKSPLF